MYDAKKVFGYLSENLKIGNIERYEETNKYDAIFMLFDKDRRDSPFSIWIGIHINPKGAWIDEEKRIAKGRSFPSSIFILVKNYDETNQRVYIRWDFTNDEITNIKLDAMINRIKRTLESKGHIEKISKLVK